MRQWSPLCQNHQQCRVARGVSPFPVRPNRDQCDRQNDAQTPVLRSDRRTNTLWNETGFDRWSWMPAPRFATSDLRALRPGANAMCNGLKTDHQDEWKTVPAMVWYILAKHPCRVCEIVMIWSFKLLIVIIAICSRRATKQKMLLLSCIIIIFLTKKCLLYYTSTHHHHSSAL